jgi:hypothetical protein
MITSEHLRLLEAEDRLLAIWRTLCDGEHWPSAPKRDLDPASREDLRPVAHDTKVPSR